MAKIPKGRISVIKDNLEARLSWEPDENGPEWDEPALEDLLKQANVRIPPLENSLLEALKLFSGSAEPGESEIVARGTPAKPPVPETAEWDEQPSPPEIAAIQEEILRKAALPNFPGGGNFDPRIRKSMWVTPEFAAAAITPAAAGEPGTALDGTPLPPPSAGRDTMLLGEGLRRRDDAIEATITGLVRIGEDWVDMIPCPLPEWTLHATPDKGTCLLDFAPGHPLLPRPDPTGIWNEAQNQGYAVEDLIPPEDILRALDNAVRTGIPLQDFPLSVSSDAHIAVEIDSSRILAVLILRKGTGSGKALELSQVGPAIRNSGVVGVDSEKLKAEIMAFYRGEDLEARIVLKEGKSAERGPDRELSFSVAFFNDEETTAIKQRLADDEGLLKGFPSSRTFAHENITKTAPVSTGQEIFVLGEAKIGASGKDIDGVVLPGLPGNDPFLRIHEGILWNEGKAVARDAGILDLGEKDGIWDLRVRPHEDVEIIIDIPEDAMRALLSLRPPVGSGAPADIERIKKAADEAGVTKGLLEEKITEAVAMTTQGEFVSGHVIAEGRLPMEGNSRLRLLVDGDPAKTPVPVKAEQILGEIQEGGEGGYDVKGNRLVSEGGSVVTGEHIERRDDNERSVLVATKSGLLHMDGTTLVVRNELNVKGDVTLATGNIRFPGSVKVSGSVLSRIVVEAGDAITVEEVVQASLLSAGSDVVIGQGIKGEGKAVVRTQGGLELGYAEEANLLVTGNLKAAKALLHCRIKCNGRLIQEGADGRVIGGSLKVKEGMNVASVGTEKGVETHISFGQDYLVENQIESIKGELAKVQDYLIRIDKLMNDLERKGNKGGLISVRKKKVDALKVLNKKNLKLFLLREKYEEHFESEVRVRDTAWPGVVFESHGRTIKVQEPLRRVIIHFDREAGRLEQRPL